MVEENLYSGRSEAEQASSLEQVLEQLARPAKEEFQDKDLACASFPQSFGKKEFEEMVAPSAGLYSKRRYVPMRAQSTFSADFTGETARLLPQFACDQSLRIISTFMILGVPNYRC